MNLPLVCTLLALAGLAPASPAQSVPGAASGYDLISIYAPVRTSVPGVKGFFTPQGTRYTGIHPDFIAGDWIEIDLRRDEEGRPARVAYVCSYAYDRGAWTYPPASMVFDLFAKPDDASPFQAAGELLVSRDEDPYHPRIFPLHFPAVTLRLVARSAPTAPLDINWIGVGALPHLRPELTIQQHSWYLAAPAPGAPAGASFSAPSSGTLGILFGAAGPALLSQPIRVGLPGFGGLLLDPTVAQVLQTEVFLGGGWRVDIYFPFDPILLSTQVHFQTANIRNDPLLGLVVTWTAPLTF